MFCITCFIHTNKGWSKITPCWYYHPFLLPHPARTETVQWETDRLWKTERPKDKDRSLSHKIGSNGPNQSATSFPSPNPTPPRLTPLQDQRVRYYRYRASYISSQGHSQLLHNKDGEGLKLIMASGIRPEEVWNYVYLFLLLHYFTTVTLLTNQTHVQLILQHTEWKKLSRATDDCALQWTQRETNDSQADHFLKWSDEISLLFFFSVCISWLREQHHIGKSKSRLNHRQDKQTCSLLFSLVHREKYSTNTHDPEHIICSFRFNESQCSSYQGKFYKRNKMCVGFLCRLFQHTVWNTLLQHVLRHMNFN